MKKRVLVVDNLAGIWPHSLQLTKVAKQLDPSTFSVSYVSCGTAATSFCTVQESRAQVFGNGETRKATCRDCRFTARLNSLALGVDSKLNIFLNALVDSQMIKTENEFLSKIGRDLQAHLDDRLSDTPVVRFALYESILKFKKRNLDFSDSEFNYFEAQLRNAVKFTLLGEKFFSADSNFHAILAYTPQYAINNAFLHQAHKRGIKVFFVDGNGNIAERSSAVVLWDWDLYKLTNPALANWKPNAPMPLNAEEIKRIAAHKRQLLDGRSFSVYSAPFRSGISVRDHFQIPNKGKLWTLALSSVDEAFAAQIIGAFPESKYPGTVFADQFQWVRETVDWVSRNKDVQLVIRMHPRDLPNKREKIKSEQAFLWEKLLEDLPENVKLNHPNEGIPIRSLLESSDAFLTGWSSAAVEAMDLGIPVVTYDRELPGFPASIHLTGNSRSQYFENLNLLKTTKKSLKIRNDANRWLVHLYNAGSVRLTGRLFEKFRLNGPKWFPRALNAIDVFMPYIFRPFEAVMTIKKTTEGKKISSTVLALSADLYDECQGRKS